MTKLPINEEKWGSITTTGNNHYIISFNVLNNHYYLYYEDENSKIERVASSTDSVELIKKISSQKGK